MVSEPHNKALAEEELFERVCALRAAMTPGPWRVWKERGQYKQLTVLEVCETADRGRHSHFASIAMHWPEAEANADAIALLPEVMDAYAALRERVARLEQERDWQYEENVARIAAQAKAESERDEARRLAEQERDDGQLASEAVASVTDLEKMAQALVPVWEKDVLNVGKL